MAKDEDFATTVGAGGETHQHVPRQGPHDPDAHLTTNQGIRVSDNQNSLKAGARGPTLLEDFVLREKIFHFDHERTPDPRRGGFVADLDRSRLEKAPTYTAAEMPNWSDRTYGNRIDEFYGVPSYWGMI